MIFEVENVTVIFPKMAVDWLLRKKLCHWTLRRAVSYSEKEFKTKFYCAWNILCSVTTIEDVSIDILAQFEDEIEKQIHEPVHFRL